MMQLRSSQCRPVESGAKAISGTCSVCKGKGGTVQESGLSKPHWPQDHFDKESVVRAKSSQGSKEVQSNLCSLIVGPKPLYHCPASVKVDRNRVQGFRAQHPVHWAHQLPRRPKFENDGQTGGPPRFDDYVRPHVYPRQGRKPLVDHSGMHPYIPNRRGIPSSAGRHGFYVPPSQYDFPILAHSNYAFEQSYRHDACLAPVIPQVGGSFKTPYPYNAPALLASPLVFPRQEILAEAVNSRAHIRIEAHEFIPGAHVHGF